jgi:hypothetical protein
MIAIADLRELAMTRLRDAEALYAAGQYDTSVYVCGYCVELLLKSRICRTLHWDGFPDSNSEFQRYLSFRTHDLEALLHLSGVERQVSGEHEDAWRTVVKWNPGWRYRVTGTSSASDAALMLNAVTQLVEVI